MTALLNWVSGNPVRAFVATGIASLIALFALPMTAWIPAGLVVFAMLIRSDGLAAAAGTGAAVAFAAVYGPLYGAGAAAAIALAILLPAALTGHALHRTRSLSFVFQSATVGACLLVLAIHALVGDPLRALAPLLSELEPLLRPIADALTRSGIEASPREIGEAAARVAWGFLAWTVLLHTMLALFAGLWAFGRVREPGLFAREFRQLRLGRFVAWLLVAAFLTNLVALRLFAPGWQAADDIVFVLAAAFLLQSLAVVHGLRELQIIGIVPVVLAYVAVVFLPHLLVAIGLADTWIRFRERFVKR